MESDNDHRHIEENLLSMNTRLTVLEERMSSIDTKLTQVVDAILGNKLTKSGGFVAEINTLKSKIAALEAKAEKAEEFKKRILWTIGIVVTVALIIEYATKIYSNLK